jgi:hypothetical protein
MTLAAIADPPTTEQEPRISGLHTLRAATGWPSLPTDLVPAGRPLTPRKGRSVRKVLLGLLLTGVALAIGLQPAFASPAVHTEEDVTGAVFTCSTTSYTIISGSIRLVLHQDVTASGNMNVTGTITPQQVVAQDEAGNLYDIVGAGWFGGSMNAKTGGGAFTDTEKFQVVRQGGGTVGSVNLTTHISPNGDSFSFDFGTCVPPGD